MRGEPLVASGATMRVRATGADPSADIAAVIRKAEQDSTVANSLKRGFPVVTLPAAPD